MIFGTCPLRFAGFPVSGWIDNRAALRESLQFSEGSLLYPQTCRSASYPQIWNVDIWYHFDTVSIMAMTLRLTLEEEQILNRYAKQTGLSKQKAIIHALRLVETQSAKQIRLDEAVEFVLSHDKELMERLADA